MRRRALELFGAAGAHHVPAHRELLRSVGAGSGAQDASREREVQRRRSSAGRLLRDQAAEGAARERVAAVGHDEQAALVQAAQRLERRGGRKARGGDQLRQAERAALEAQQAHEPPRLRAQVGQPIDQ